MAARKFCLRLRFLMVCGVVLLSLGLVSSALAALSADTTIADFSAGTVGSCYVAPSTWDGGIDGEVILSPTLATGFPGTSVPADWYTGSYNATDFPVVANDFITVNFSYAGVTSLYSPGQTIEFEAVFNGPNQWVGFASDTKLDNTPWALFGTFGESTNLLANTSFAAQTQVITGGLGIPHRFRIDWIPNLVNYYIDDVLVATHNVDVAVSMRPLIADNASGNLLSVDWLRIGPYVPTNCTYTSTLLDSGIAMFNWISMTTSVYVPTNTTLSFETRSGADPDTAHASWSAWQAVSGDNIDSPNGRYLQYRALLTTPDSLATPRVYSVEPHGSTPTAIQLSSIGGRSAATPAIWLLAFVTGLMGIVLGYQMWRTRWPRR